MRRKDEADCGLRSLRSEGEGDAVCFFWGAAGCLISALSGLDLQGPHVDIAWPHAMPFVWTCYLGRFSFVWAGLVFHLLPLLRLSGGGGASLQRELV